MKKHCFALVMILLMVLSVGSTELHSGVEFGVKGGIQDDGIRAGIFAGFKISKYLMIQPEVHVSQLKHPSVVYNFLDNNVLFPGTKLSDKVNAIEVPVLLKIKFKLPGFFRPFLQIGGYSWFKMGGDDDLFHSEALPPQDWQPQQIQHSSVSTGRKYTKSGAGFIVSPGFTLGNGKVKFLMDFRLTYDLTVRQKVDYLVYVVSDGGGEELYSSYTANFKNRTFSVMCGIVF